MPYLYHIDPLYLIMMLPVIIISLIVQGAVKSSFKKYSQYRVRSGITGSKAAQIILSKTGINNVNIEQTGGMLSDHYSPVQKVLRLSQDVYNSPSISAVGVAAHEAGHAIQHYKGMLIMRMWMALARPAAFFSNAAIILIIIGSIFSLLALAKIGFFFFLGVVAFQVITLPLEFNASNRAKKLLVQYGIVTQEELKGVNSVLNSAAMTYVAAAAAAIVQLLYFALRLGLLGGRRR